MRCGDYVNVMCYVYVGDWSVSEVSVWVPGLSDEASCTLCQLLFSILLFWYMC